MPLKLMPTDIYFCVWNAHNNVSSMIDDYTYFPKVAEVKKTWMYTSSPPIRLHDVVLN
jgi:hypothetical protein